MTVCLVTSPETSLNRTKVQRTTYLNKSSRETLFDKGQITIQREEENKSKMDKASKSHNSLTCWQFLYTTFQREVQILTYNVQETKRILEDQMDKSEEYCTTAPMGIGRPTTLICAWCEQCPESDGNSTQCSQLQTSTKERCIINFTYFIQKGCPSMMGLLQRKGMCDLL